MANIAVRRAVYCLVVIPAILEGHAHCVAVKVFVVSDVFAHGDVLFVVWVDGLIITQMGVGARGLCTKPPENEGYRNLVNLFYFTKQQE